MRTACTMRSVTDASPCRRKKPGPYSATQTPFQFQSKKRLRACLTFRSSRPGFSFAVLRCKTASLQNTGGLTQTLGTPTPAVVCVAVQQATWPCRRPIGTRCAAQLHSHRQPDWSIAPTVTPAAYGRPAALQPTQLPAAYGRLASPQHTRCLLP